MKIRTLLSTICVALCIIACDETTGTLGYGLTSKSDSLAISSETYYITTRSIAADSVFARNTLSYLGTILDPETGEYISANFMTQFHTLEDYQFPKLDSIVSRDENGMVQADSCEIRLFFNKFYGDSLTAMKCTVTELDRPMKENEVYYSNFDPKAEGFLRKDGLKVSKTYTLTDMNVPIGTRDGSDYTKNIRITLNEPYTDKNGVTYNNYGTYIMRKYYEDPTLFKNSIRLANIIPGMYVESTGGVGSMAYVMLPQLNLYFEYHGKSDTTSYVGTTSFSGTQEVLQKTNFVNEKEKIQELVDKDDCTYLKTPAGIFTEVTIPVDEVCYGHDNDTINTAQFILQRINNDVQSEYNYDIPSTVLLLPKDSLYSFFENKSIPNYKTSYLATYSSTNNTYIFNNIGSMIKAMQQAKLNGETSEDWNKAVVIPVTTSTNSSSAIVKTVHNMALTSTRLVGGPNNPHDPIKLYVIYSKYK